MATPQLEPGRIVSNQSIKAAIEELEGMYGITVEKAADLVGHQDWSLIEQMLIYRRELLKETIMRVPLEAVQEIQGQAQSLQFLLDLPAKLEGIKILKTKHQTQEQS